MKEITEQEIMEFFERFPTNGLERPLMVVSPRVLEMLFNAKREADGPWQKLVERYANGREICNCGMRRKPS